jgi:ParB-like chromosome segregation protein Spo0J
MAKAKAKPAIKAMAIRRIKLSELKLDPKNLRDHDARNLDMIAESLKAHGQVEPLVVQAKTLKVIGGNGRLVAMRKIGLTEADIVELDINDTEAAILSIRLNRTAEFGKWNESIANALEGLKADGVNLDAIGFSDTELNELCKTLATEAITPLSMESLPDLSGKANHQITISYTLDDEDAIRAFVKQQDDGPLSPQIGKMILGRIKAIASH